MTRFWAVLSCLVLAPAAVAAQAPSAAHSIVVTIDNDLIAIRGAGVPPDYDYTHGATVAISWAGAPESLRRALGRRHNCPGAEARHRGCIATALAVGQRIYTPRHDAAEPVAGERPYAGWLYAAAMVRVVARDYVRSLGAEVGVTGPPSLAEPVQNGVHRLLHNEAQRGWTHQLSAAPGFAVRYDEVRRSEWEVGRMGLAAIALRWGATAGTVVTGFAGGAEGTLGLRGDLPWSPSEPEVARPTRLSVLVAFRQDAILHNVFVEGRGASGRAEPRPFVGQAELGVRYRRRTVAFEYRHVVRGREYRAQPAAHRYGSVTVVVHGF